jgi:hypothetical protein
MQVSIVTLLAKQEKCPPTGIQLPSRDIGFASVFVRSGNCQSESNTLIIRAIEIRNEEHKLQAFSLPLQKIHLRSHENAEHVFHLTNKTGYTGQIFYALVVYQVGQQIYFIESPAVKVTLL